MINIEKLDQWAEWIAQGVYDDPAIETREEFKQAVAMAILDAVKDITKESQSENSMPKVRI